MPSGGALRTARRMARFVPFHRVFHSVELSLLILVAAVVDLCARRAGHPGAAGRAGGGRRRHRRRPPGRRAGLVAAAMSEPERPTVRRGGADHGQPARRPAAWAGLAAGPASTSISMSWWSATAGSRSACRTACRPLGCRRTWAFRPAAMPECRWCAATCCSSSTTTPACRGPTCWPGWRPQFAADPELGLIQPRVVDPDGSDARRAAGRPGCGSGDPARSSPAMNIWEGAVAMRRAAFDYAEGWPEPFWYAHEGIELAWRVWDAGYHVRYDGEIEVSPPGDPADPARGVLPVPGPEPGLARPAQPALAGRSAVRRQLGRGRPPPGCGRGRVWSRPCAVTGSGCGPRPGRGGRCAGVRSGGWPGRPPADHLTGCCSLARQPVSFPCCMGN